jgi:hypothetical protein
MIEVFIMRLNDSKFIIKSLIDATMIMLMIASLKISNTALETKLIEFINKQPIKSFSSKHITQLIPYSLLNKPHVPFENSIQKEIIGAYKTNKEEIPGISTLHEAIWQSICYNSARIERLAPYSNFENEHYHCGYFIDTALIGDKMVAIQADGPSHYGRSIEDVNRNIPPGKMTHKTSLRNEVLTLRGWKLMIISYYDWNNTKDKQRYVMERLSPYLEQTKLSSNQQGLNSFNPKLENKNRKEEKPYQSRNEAYHI